MTPAPAAANPYVGLRPFDREDSLYYFGRREQTSELLEQLHRHRFLAVVGSSGCGKSSLVRAGLIPALFGGFLVESRDHWLVAVMKPGDAPTLNLASALCAVACPPSPRAAEALEKAINEDQAEAVVEFMRPVLGPDANLLIVVDQFEEIFTFRGAEDEDQFDELSAPLRRERGRNRAEASNFVDLLLSLAPANLPIYVVLTMRSDFLGDCELFYGLPEAMNKSRYLVPRLTRQQLREAVQGPALLSSVQVTPRLMDTVLNDLGGRSDQLPVLQHALYRTWNEWAKTKEGPLDLPHYQAIGELKGALSQHASEALRQEDLADTARVFKCLTDTDPNQRRIRRPAHLKELADLCGGRTAAVMAIIERFRGDGRNFVVVSKARDGDLRIDISHESLIRQWPQLREWIDAERVSRDHYLDLVKGARANRALLQDPDLQLALNWRDENWPTAAWAKRYSSHDGDFEAAMHYLDASQQAAAAAVRKKKLSQLYVRTAAGAVMLVLAVLMSFAFLEWGRAKEESVRARAAEERAKSAESAAQSLKDQFKNYSVALEAHKATPTLAAALRATVAPQAKPPVNEVPVIAAVPAPSTVVDPGPGPKQTTTVLPPLISNIAIPPSPVTLSGNDRFMTYSNISLGFLGNAIAVSPGQTFTVSFKWKCSVPKEPPCPTCFVQFYYGISSKAGGGSNCFVSDVIGPGWSKDGEVKGTLKAPAANGTYYITQATTTEPSCQVDKADQSGELKDALGVIMVR